MIKVSAADFQRNIGRYQDLALREPVTITRNGRPRTVMISTEEYARLRRGDREAIRPEEISDEELEAVMRAEPPSEAAEYDDEMRGS
ncbi:MAG: prevent-host-death protein [Ancylobacter novellus]|uniref:Antitoxin n=1 Tax=Ancylobacter novellus TaxID=921 RepID=A0A2W5KJA5_ANCNO|nr:MAG: prevent-host-death protein [Ancylobacter novellus]